MAEHEATANIIGTASQQWQPVFLGDGELQRLLARKLSNDEAAQRSIRENSLNILSKCIDPQDGDAPSRTGLVVGHVQSGKTMSFTAVAAAAHDNGFRSVVVIAGSSLNLAEQNRDRLADDLDIRSPFRPWYRRHNPTTAQLDQLRSPLVGWDSESGRGKTLLLTSLKHYRHVQNLGEVLEALGDAAAPMLIVDDEADQISLNTRVNQGEHSANYAQILSLRDRAPRHTYLQYTATPQANIFIPLWDRLSPEFCEILEPGDGYVGGHRVFIERGDDLIRTIDHSDLDRADELVDPPESLFEALRIFFLGVAQGIVEYQQTGVEPSPPNRSMMVHPSHRQNSHQVFYNWITTCKDSWHRLLQDPSDPDHGPLLETFRAAYDDIRSTDRFGTLAPFESLMAVIPQWIGQTQVREVNARVDRTDWSTEWGTEYPWILVGGQNLDRGFTVEGLTVTYMPRSIGTGQADTIQQRARFFGYKASYEDLCRVYVGADAKRAFEVYVRHEQSMRDFLERRKDRLNDASIPREFELDPQLRPTRRQVLVQNPDRYILKYGWLAQQAPLERVRRSRQNGELVDTYLFQHGGTTASDNVPWIHAPDQIRNDHRHAICSGITLRDIYENLLVNIILPDPEEHTEWQVAMSMISNALDEHDGLEASIIQMRPESEPFRGLDDNRRIKQVFAGAYPGNQPYAYAGDREARLGDVTLQLHRFNLGTGADSESSQGREVQEPGVPVLALWLGDSVNRPMIRQEQPTT